jgi:hypothetical protein
MIRVVSVPIPSEWTACLAVASNAFSAGRSASRRRGLQSTGILRLRRPLMD